MIERIIEGFRVDVTSTELAAHLGKRIDHHRRKVGEWEKTINELKDSNKAQPVLPSGIRSGYMLAAQPDSESYACFQKLHTMRADYLGFVIAHLIPDVVYRLDETDLVRLEYAGDLETIPTVAASLPHRLSHF